MVAVNDAYCKYSLRQPLRHRTVRVGRHQPDDEPGRRRQDRGRHRLRLVRQRRGDAGERDWARRWSSPRSMRSRRSRPIWTALPSCRWRRRRKSAISSSRSPGTGTLSVSEHYEVMKDGAILANAGHFDVESEQAGSGGDGGDPSGRCAKHRGISSWRTAGNCTCWRRAVSSTWRPGDGHPAEIMDMTFALQALCLKYVNDNHEKIGSRVIDVPYEPMNRSPVSSWNPWESKSMI